MKSKHLAILFVLILISCLMSSCATIPVRKPLTEELSGVAQIPDIPRARFWGDEAPPFFEAVIDQPREKLKQAFPGIYGKAHNYLALSGGGSNGAFGAGLMVGWSAAGTSVQAFEIITREMIEKEIVTETDLIKTADNFIILFDASSSANEMVPGKSIRKIQATKELLKRSNAQLPDLGYTAGLYVYTTESGDLRELYAPQAYNRNAFGAAIDQLPEEGKGPTMLQSGLSSLRKVVAGLNGKTVVFIFTDGSYSQIRGPKKPLQIAQEIVKDKDVCFYLISSADEAAEKQVVQAVTKINSCSRVIPLAMFLDNPQYSSGALFIVKTTAYERLIPVTEVVGFVADDVLFDLNSADLRPEYGDKKMMLVDFLQQNPDTYVVVAGFANSVGDEEYNLGLSERRAESVKSALTNAGIDGDRVVTLWFGELNPVADNMTDEGRQLNRRVEIAVGK